MRICSDNKRFSKAARERAVNKFDVRPILRGIRLYLNRCYQIKRDKLMKFGEIWAEAKRIRNAEFGMRKRREENAKSNSFNAGL